MVIRDYDDVDDNNDVGNNIRVCVHKSTKLTDAGIVQARLWICPH